MVYNVTIILPAKAIPDLRTVRKVTGQVQYVLRHKFPVYVQGQDSKTLQTLTGLAGMLFLVGENGVTAISGDQRLAVDLPIAEAIETLQQLELELIGD